MAKTETPDLAILDIAMPRLTGLQAARELSRRQPDLGILILTMYDNAARDARGASRVGR